jgi:GAF domain-containing protein/nitrogen-specific signal transduction histidine kinase
VQPLLPETRSEMALPLKVGDQVIGVLDVQSDKKSAFDEDDVQILQTMADQLAVAIDNLRLLAEVQKRAGELEGLYNAVLVTSGELDINALLGHLYEQVQQYITSDSFLVALYDSDREAIEVPLAVENGETVSILDGNYIPLSESGFSGHVIKSRCSLLIEDIDTADLPITPVVVSEEKCRTRAWLGVPLIAHDQVLGVVSIQAYKPNAFDERHQRFLESLAAQVAIALENAHLFEAERSARDQAETLREIARLVSGSLEINQILNLILEQIKRVVDFDTASVLLFDEKFKSALVAGSGYQDDRITSAAASDLLKESPILQKIAETLQPFIIPDVSQHPDWIWVPGAEHVRSFLGVPIIIRKKMMGVVMLDRVQENAFTEDNARTIQAVAQHMSIAIETVRLFEAERNQLLLARTLQEVGMLLTAELGTDEVLERILDLLARAVQYDSVSVQLMEAEEQLYFAAGRGFDDLEEIDRVVRELSSHNLGRFEHNQEQVIVIVDTAQDDSWLIKEKVDHIRSWICAPLLVRGKLIGLLTVDSNTPNALTDEVATTVMAFASQAAIAIENAQLFEAERSARERAEALRKAVQIINSTLSLNQIIRVILEQIASVLHYDSGSVILIEGERAYVQDGIGYDDIPEAKYLSEIELDLNVETIRFIFHERQPLMIPDIRQDNRWLHTAVTRYIRTWLGVPLQVREQVVGIINLERNTPVGFTDDEIALAQVFAAHTSTAIENARLFETEEKRAEELETLRQVGLSLTASLEPDAVIDAVLEGVFKLMPRIWHTNIFLFEGDELTLSAEFWVDKNSKLSLLSSPARESMHRAASNGELLVKPEFPLNQLFRDLDEEDFNGSLLCLPLKIGDRVTGVMNVVYADTQTISPAELRVLNLLGDQAALAIENAHLFGQTAVERRHISLLYDVGRSIATSLEPSVILKAAIDLTYEALEGNAGGAWLYLHEEKILRTQAVHHHKNLQLDEIAKITNIDIPLGEGLIGWVAENRTAVNIPNVEEDPRWIPEPYIDENVVSMIAAPILEGENLLGVLAVQRDYSNTFEQSQLNLLQAICAQVSLALSNARRYQDVDRLVSLLAAEQFRLEGLIEMLPVGVLLLDERQNLLVTNSLAREFLLDLTPGYDGLTVSHLGSYSISDLLERYEDPLPTEIILDVPDHRIFEVEARSIQTETPQWIITLRDVTQEREIQDRVQMQERLATVGQLAAGIAHDFNNIMAAIVVYADLLRMDSTISSSSQERLAIIQQQVQRAASLIRQILDFSRRSVMEQSSLNLLPFLKEIEKLLIRTLPETIHVELHAPESEYILSADPTRLQQVFMNLAVNARDAMPEGGTLRFDLALVQVTEGDAPLTADITPGNWIHIRVSDTGIGIPPEDQSHIFEPFFTTKPVGQGTGLGLAQVYGIVKQHDGFIDMRSQVGEGTQFNIYLPTLSQPLKTSRIEETSMEIDGGGKTVLLVEDDFATRKALQTMLSLHNYNVLAAENGLDALAHLEESASEIVMVVSDVVMPQMGGFDLYEKIQPRWPHIEILFITGHPLDDQNQAILQQGKVHWLQKPFTVQEFNQTMFDLLS